MLHIVDVVDVDRSFLQECGRVGSRFSNGLFWSFSEIFLILWFKVAEKRSVCLVFEVCLQFFYIVDEAHVQHSIGFIQYEVFHFRKFDLSPLEVVDQAARGGNQDVVGSGEESVLLSIGHPAVDADGFDVGEVAAKSHGFF